MSIESRKQLDVTQSKLAMLEETYRIIQSTKSLSHADELTLESLSRRINKLREEIARFNAHQPVASRQVDLAQGSHHVRQSESNW